MALPATYGPVFHREYDSYPAKFTICGACAIGTVLYAAAGVEGVRQMDAWPAGAADFIEDFIEARWPWTRDWRKQQNGSSFSNRLITLFEGNNWPREQIADWIEEQERETERQRALTNSTSDVRGTTECASPVLATRA